MSTPTRMVLFGPAGAGKSALLAALKQEDPHLDLHESGLPIGDTLPKEVQKADAVILVADSSGGAAQLEKDFTKLADLIQRLETRRSQAAEPVGLPVYFVLAKCDKLAKASDNAIQWMQRVEEGKRKIDKHLTDSLSRVEDRDDLPFGKTDVHVWATATQRPPLNDKPGEKKPYGISELLRQCIDSAKEYHAVRDRAHQRMQGLLVGFGGLLAILGLVAFALILNRPDAELANFENAVRLVAPAETSTAGDRLREPLQERLDEIQKLEHDPNFDRLPAALREKVTSLRDEIVLYQKVYKEFLQKVPDLRSAKEEADLTRIEKSVSEFELDPELEKQWADTKLETRRKFLTEEIAKLREAVKSQQAWFTGQVERGEKLEIRGGLFLGKMGDLKEKDLWLAEAKAYANQPLPHKESERLAGTTLPWAVVYRFRSVEQSRREWLKMKEAVSYLQSRVK